MDELEWTTAASGASAMGQVLFVPTDDGIQRFEACGGAVRATRTFAETEPFVDAASRLLVVPVGIYAANTSRTVYLTLKGPKP